MQISLYRQKLKRRGLKSVETKKVGQFATTDIILGFIKTEKTDSQLKIVSKVKVPQLDKEWNKKKEKYSVTFKSGRTIEKERVKVEVVEKEKIKLAFKVMKWANKIDVKTALQSLYWLKIDSVNIIKSPYKKRQRKGLVRRSYVKAIVTLKEGGKVPSFDNVL